MKIAVQVRLFIPQQLTIQQTSVVALVLVLRQGSDAALSINADTGAVTLSTDLDHETQAAYSFTVVATDTAGNISTSQAVTLSDQ